MAKGYSTDLRVRAIALYEDGESAREAARLLEVGASTAVRWVLDLPGFSGERFALAGCRSGTLLRTLPG